MTFAELLAAAADTSARALAVCLPATVDSYDASAQTIDAAPSVGAPTPIHAVPVLFPVGSSMACTLPVAQGDRVVLVFADRSLDDWWAGRNGEPTDTRTHARTDCFALLGGRPQTAPLPAVDTSRAVLGGTATDAPRVAVGSDAVHLGVAHGASGADAVALAGKVQQQLTALKNAIEAWTPVPQDGGAALKVALTTLFTTWPGSVAAAKTRAT